MDMSNSLAIESCNPSKVCKEVHTKLVTPDLKDVRLFIITHHQEVPV
jgi:hypothetical protein